MPSSPSLTSVSSSTTRESATSNWSSITCHDSSSHSEAAAHSLKALKTHSPEHRPTDKGVKLASNNPADIEKQVVKNTVNKRAAQHLFRHDNHPLHFAVSFFCYLAILTICLTRVVLLWDNNDFSLDLLSELVCWGCIAGALARFFDTTLRMAMAEVANMDPDGSLKSTVLFIAGSFGEPAAMVAGACITAIMLPFGIRPRPDGSANCTSSATSTASIVPTTTVTEALTATVVQIITVTAGLLAGQPGPPA